MPAAMANVSALSVSNRSSRLTAAPSKRVPGDADTEAVKRRLRVDTLLYIPEWNLSVN
jgi:hypothetical protein